MKSIDHDFVSPDKLRVLESKALKYIKDHASAVDAGFARMSTDAAPAYSILVSGKPRAGVMINFESYFPSEVDGRQVFVLIGALARSAKAKPSQFEEFSYYAALCDGGAIPSKILRKFHFDYTSEGNARRNPHPRFHLQYCGGLSTSLESRGYSSPSCMQHLDAAFSPPRIPSRPVSIALLLDWLCLELNSDKKCHDFRERPEWRSLVIAHEVAILRPYYRNCADFVSQAERTPPRRAFLDFCYGIK